jgi:hypothetical protein
LTTAQTAFELAQRGFATFPVREDKTPYTENGFQDASLDPFYTQERFEKYPNALIGIATGASGIVVLDLDYKEDASGNVVLDGYESLDLSWVDVVPTFSYTSIGGKGRHMWYLAPEGVNLPRKIGYRGMAGVDRCSGEGYVVFTHDTLPERSELAPAPEWLCDASAVRSADVFEGDVKSWYETLEPGAPNVLVRRAMEDAQKLYDSRGGDFSHSDIVEFQHRAIRLGAEGATGVPELLALLEEMTENRTGEHSRSQEEYSYEFAEALNSGIKKHGEAIALRKNLPAYSLNIVPSSVPDRLLTGAAGNKDTFRELLAELIKATDDDLLVTSVLWNSPRTKDIAREWGLEFVFARVQSAREKPEPVRENPTLPERAPEKSAVNVTSTSSEVNVTSGTFLAASEQEIVNCTRTFIDKYLAASASKGFTNTAYAIPSAWTALSMAFGLKAVIPKGVNLGVNLWFMPMGYSGTGKSAETAFLKHVLDHLLKDGDGYYNLGAMSSPEGILLELLTRDGKPSMIFQDEASSFFQALRDKDWVKALEYDLSNYYMGDVPPSNKISLKEFRGKGAETSFNIFMIATPDRLLKLINTDMFATGFMARYNWMWAEPPVDGDEKYLATRSENDTEKNAPSVTFDLAGDLAHAGGQFTHRVAVWGTEDAVTRLAQAHRDFDLAAKGHEKYDALEPAITRLGRETLWKCAALLALYRGETTFTLADALVAIHYATEWYENLGRVVMATSESEFAADVAEIESYIVGQGGTVTSAKLLHRFRNMIRNSPRELEDRISFLNTSGRVNRVEQDRKVSYVING